MSELVIALAIETVSEANLREHWAPKARRVRTQRHAAKFLTLQFLNTRHVDDVKFPAEITMTRIAPRRLDDVNLLSSIKAVQDGVCDALGIDDGDQAITWHYEQRKGGVRECPVEVRIQERKP